MRPKKAAHATLNTNNSDNSPPSSNQKPHFFIPAQVKSTLSNVHPKTTALQLLNNLVNENSARFDVADEIHIVQIATKNPPIRFLLKKRLLYNQNSLTLTNTKIALLRKLLEILKLPAHTHSILTTAAALTLGELAHHNVSAFPAQFFLAHKFVPTKHASYALSFELCTSSLAELNCVCRFIPQQNNSKPVPVSLQLNLVYLLIKSLHNYHYSHNRPHLGLSPQTLLLDNVNHTFNLVESTNTAVHNTLANTLAIIHSNPPLARTLITNLIQDETLTPFLAPEILEYLKTLHTVSWNLDDRSSNDPPFLFPPKTHSRPLSDTFALYALFTTAADVYSVGVCVLYVFMFNSHHNVNVQDPGNLFDVKYLAKLTDYPLVLDLLTCMLRENPVQRTSTTMCLMHPLFWSISNTIDYLYACHIIIYDSSVLFKNLKLFFINKLSAELDWLGLLNSVSPCAHRYAKRFDSKNRILPDYITETFVVDSYFGLLCFLSAAVVDAQLDKQAKITIISQVLTAHPRILTVSVKFLSLTDAIRITTQHNAAILSQ